MDVFEMCHRINDLLQDGEDFEARNELIRLLDFHHTTNLSYGPLLNNLIRQTGLYPYLEPDTASWEERFVYESFKVDIGTGKPVTLHREQSLLLKKLSAGQSLAVSAPTSFGKSFVIDSFISIVKPKNVVIIVPTLALTDETRRRLQQKFSRQYKIITTADASLEEKNILIFPQERALSYLGKLTSIDILIVDEFYKASPNFDPERAAPLLRAIHKLSAISKQRYFLAPNISRLNNSPFTAGMEFVALDFNTVYLEKRDYSEEINKDDTKKREYLLRILSEAEKKSLIYAGTYSDIEKISTIIMDEVEPFEKILLKHFENWLAINYDRSWQLTGLVRRGTGVHNGKMHRSLSQIQVKLFEAPDGLNNLISTSSIIEGVNTSAENIVIWSNKNGPSKLNDFTYRNILGRGGRMFKHFIGKIFIFESPPKPEDTQLDLFIPEDLLGVLDERDKSLDLTTDQVAKIILYKEEMRDLLGDDVFKVITKGDIFQSSDSYLIKRIAEDMKRNAQSWNGMGYLNSANPNDWDRILYKAIGLHPGGWEIEYKKFIQFIKIISNSWIKTIPELLRQLDEYDIGIDKFFALERNASYKLAALLGDINILHRLIFSESHQDIAPFISKVSHAFLPAPVYQLEEYGLPRMISRKIQHSSLIDFEASQMDLHTAIDKLRAIGIDEMTKRVDGLNGFDRYILKYFFQGIGH